jgi:hypothetical protein
VKKYIISEERRESDILKFANEQGLNIRYDKLKKKKIIRLGDIQEIVARIDDADFLVYESYGIVYIYEFKI